MKSDFLQAPGIAAAEQCCERNCWFLLHFLEKRHHPRLKWGGYYVVIQ